MAVSGRSSVTLPEFVIAAAATWPVPVGARAGERPFTTADVLRGTSAAAPLDGSPGQ